MRHDDRRASQIKLEDDTEEGNNNYQESNNTFISSIQVSNEQLRLPSNNIKLSPLSPNFNQLSPHEVKFEETEQSREQSHEQGHEQVKTSSRKVLEFISSNESFDERQPPSSIDKFCFEEGLPSCHIEDNSRCNEVATSNKSITNITLSSTYITSMMDTMKQPSCGTTLCAANTPIPASFKELEVNCNTIQSRNNHNGDLSQHLNHPYLSQDYHITGIQGHQMPPLCGNSINTPTLSIQFSPFLSFSEDSRAANNIMLSHQQSVDIASEPEETTQQNGNRIEGEDENEDEKCDSDIHAISSEEVQAFLTTSSTASTTSTPHPELTYADSLLLNAFHVRDTSTSTPIREAPVTPKVIDKKRKANNSCRSSRQPQKRFSIDVERNEITGGDLFVSKRDGRVRLTTNLPRKVEAVDSITGYRTHLYASCSEASRVMGINRTRMSRSKLTIFKSCLFLLAFLAKKML